MQLKATASTQATEKVIDLHGTHRLFGTHSHRLIRFIDLGFHFMMGSLTELNIECRFVSRPFHDLQLATMF